LINNDFLCGILQSLQYDGGVKMRVAVKKEGLLIPKRFLKGVETVEIKFEKLMR